MSAAGVRGKADVRMDLMVAGVDQHLRMVVLVKIVSGYSATMRFSSATT